MRESLSPNVPYEGPPARDDWWLPLGVLHMIQHVLHRSSDDLVQVKTTFHKTYFPSAFMTGGQELVFTLVFRGPPGFPESQELITLRSKPSWGEPLIDGYRDVLTQREWIHWLVLEKGRDQFWSGVIPDYSLPDEALKIVMALLRRGEQDELLHLFAERIFAPEQIPPDLMATRLKMELLAMTFTPRRICTAAYQARTDLAWRQRR